ncbi:lysine-specific demethylase 2A-like isoform X3 [Panulirus ornatus]|uniref:lysine-specific demethylase 2A-like isoform X3 n=1 Tax=Panulirus ornatus TaxID=150431 RepID=UPI003A83E03F
MASRSTGGGTILASGIRTRERKERKLYSDDWALGDEEIEGHHTFDLEQKMKSDEFNSCFVKDMTGVEFNLGYVQENGFNWPLLFRDKSQLGIVIPNSDFSINDVRLCVGSRRMLDVMDVNTQKNVEMTMKDWQRYFESKDKDKLLNVISLEFSHTKLESLIQAPTVVRQIDWVERVWPRHLKEAQTEATNVLEDMMYPKVQKYCLMSVRGCYTDFHIDFGGTSVWYHILRGKKIFWLIPPTERNLQLYEQWVLSGKQSDIFFGDTVDKCARVELHQGNTFFIPTGWIHAVYTPEDSLVFGGNFLHSFGIEKQLRVAQVEDATHVPSKFRYPFFTEMLWYVLERYVHVLLGRTHLTLPPDEQEKYNKYLASKVKVNNNNQLNEEAEGEEDTKLDKNMTLPPEEHTHLTQYELHGLKAIVMYLHALPTSKKCVPDLITDPIALIRDVRTVVEKHRYDKPDLAKTSKPVLEWWSREPTKFGIKRPLGENTGGGIKRRRRNSDENRIVGLPPNAAKVRHRRVRCKLCESCLREDCRKCGFCMDMVKYGGPGTMKQTCKMKKCTQPMLPAAAFCYECQLDGWGRVLTTPPQKPPVNTPSSLFECCVCFKISHLKCISSKFPDADGIVNEDLPNSWECPECVKLGYNKEYKHNRVPSSRASGTGSETGDVKSPQILIGSAVVGLDAAPPHMPTWEQLQARVSRPLVRPMWVVRPNPPPPDEDEEEEEEDEESGSDGESRPVTREPLPPAMNRAVMLPVFHHLSVGDLKVAMQVCRTWAQWAINPALWKAISLAHKRVGVYHLEGVVRRQPRCLDLSWARVTAEQLSWLLARLPQLKELHLEGQGWQVVSCLTSPYCPALSLLNLSYCEGLTDSTLTALLSPPRTHRPGHRDTTTRLRQLTDLRLAGTQVGDEGVRAIVRSLPFLSALDLSSCQRITELSAALLAHPSSVVSHSLSSLDVRGCHRLAPTCLPSLACLPLLSNLALHPCSHIPLAALRVWGKSHGYTLQEDEILSRTPPPPPDPTADPSSDSDISSVSRSSSPDVDQTGKENSEAVICNEEEEKEIECTENSVCNAQDGIDKDEHSDVSKKTDAESCKKIDSESPTKSNVIPVSKIKTVSSTSGKKKSDKMEETNKEEGKEIGSLLKSKSPEEEPSECPQSTNFPPKGGTNLTLSGSQRVSTRRQSRLQEYEGETGTVLEQASKKNTSSEQVSKNTVSSEVSKKNPVSSQQVNKKVVLPSPEQGTVSKTPVEQDNKKNAKSFTERTTKKSLMFPEQTSKKNIPLPQQISKKNIPSPELESKKNTTVSPEQASGKNSPEQVCRKNGSSEQVSKKNSSPDQVTSKNSLPELVTENKISAEQESQNPEQSSKKDLPSDQGTKKNSSSEEVNKKNSCELVSKKSSSPEEGSSKKNSNDQERWKNVPPDQVTKTNTILLPEVNKLNTSSSEEVFKKNSVPSEQACQKNTSSSDQSSKKSIASSPEGAVIKNSQSSEQVSKKNTSSLSEHTSKKNEASSSEQANKKKPVEKKNTPSSQQNKSSDAQLNQKNVIITAVEVHRADTDEGKVDQSTSLRRPERRQSVRRSKDEQEVKVDEKREKNERLGNESPKDKRKDPKTREEEMNKITVEDSSEKDSKQHNTKKMEEKEKKLNLVNKRLPEKPQESSSRAVKPEKDIVTRSTKRLKSEKGIEERQHEVVKEEDVSKPNESSVDIRKISRRTKDLRDEKEETVVEEAQKKDVKLPRPSSGRREKESVAGKSNEKKEEDQKSVKRNRPDTEEYMSKLRRKSCDDVSSDSSAVETGKKEDINEERIKSRRRSVRDDETGKTGAERKQKDDAKVEKNKVTQTANEPTESVAKQSKNQVDSPDIAVKQSKRKSEDGEDTALSSKKGKEDCEEGGKAVKKTTEITRERSGSRERPERAHRSPRRLSMCQ